jgi:hypothetical protein
MLGIGSALRNEAAFAYGQNYPTIDSTRSARGSPHRKIRGGATKLSGYDIWRKSKKTRGFRRMDGDIAKCFKNRRKIFMFFPQEKNEV